MLRALVSTYTSVYNKNVWFKAYLPRSLSRNLFYKEMIFNLLKNRPKCVGCT